MTNNFWKFSTFFLLTLFLWPGKHQELRLEPADDVWPQVQDYLSNHQYPPMVTLSHMYVIGDGVMSWTLLDKDGHPKKKSCNCPPEEPERYFTHERTAYHWPWWNLPMTANPSIAEGKVVIYTNHITWQEVWEHRHLYTSMEMPPYPPAMFEPWWLKQKAVDDLLARGPMGDGLLGLACLGGCDTTGISSVTFTTWLETDSQKNLTFTHNTFLKGDRPLPDTWTVKNDHCLSAPCLVDPADAYQYVTFPACDFDKKRNIISNQKCHVRGR